MERQAVIFDLDGVIVSTDDCHYRAWKRLADDEGIYFDREINLRLRGVSRMDCLEVMLERTSRTYNTEQKSEMADRKNNYYRKLIQQLTPDHILPGVMPILKDLKKNGIKIAIGSSSKNTPLILERIGLAGYFDAVADGNDLTKSKPDPEVFLIAAQRLGVLPKNCLVIEDADAGVEAALAADMLVLGVGTAAGNNRATLRARALDVVSAEELINIISNRNQALHN
ncbi:MAG TPA: beta-phosphoglucomutase [Firmicutes bacterium]|jgi:beta-phosphoglucomutase|nr:beta-phosphoglucomutase [Bacillota bacterium]